MQTHRLPHVIANCGLGLCVELMELCCLSPLRSLVSPASVKSVLIFFSSVSEHIWLETNRHLSEENVRV